MQRDVRRPVAPFELRARAARAWIVVARSRCFVDVPQFFPPGTPGKMKQQFDHPNMWRDDDMIRNFASQFVPDEVFGSDSTTHVSTAPS
jgi:hypothetical protein